MDRSTRFGPVSSATRHRSQRAGRPLLRRAAHARHDAGGGPELCGEPVRIAHLRLADARDAFRRVGAGAVLCHFSGRYRFYFLGLARLRADQPGDRILRFDSGERAGSRVFSPEVVPLDAWPERDPEGAGFWLTDHRRLAHQHPVR